MTYLADIIMLVIMVPTLLITFFYEYPAKWRDRKFIFGVRNREEFKDEKAASAIDKIVSDTRKLALILMLCSFAMMGLIMLIPDYVVRLCIWVVMILAILIIFMIPFMRSNREMKILKKEIGINTNAGTTYTDLKGAGSVRALKTVNIVIPNAVTAVFFIACLLYDLGIIKSPSTTVADSGTSFMMTSMSGSFLFVGLLLIPIAVMMDKIRNDVISSDSDTNRNYNRARKKVFADTFILMSWANAAVTLLYALLLFFLNSNVVFVIQILVYMILIMGAMAVLVGKSLAIDKRYRKETNIDVDDDDKWLLGSFYYNPDDKRLNVAKRMGIGGTINLGHPAGKVITVVSAVFIIGVLAVMFFSLTLGKTSMRLRIENDTLVCNQLVDIYKIPLSDISDVEYCEHISDFSMHKQAGIGMPPLFTGTFVVNGEKNCRVFLNVDADCYIRFEADGVTYYISGNTEAETADLLKEVLAH